MKSESQDLKRMLASARAKQIVKTAETLEEVVKSEIRRRMIDHLRAALAIAGAPNAANNIKTLIDGYKQGFLP